MKRKGESVVYPRIPSDQVSSCSRSVPYDKN